MTRNRFEAPQEEKKSGGQVVSRTLSTNVLRYVSFSHCRTCAPTQRAGDLSRWNTQCDSWVQMHLQKVPLKSFKNVRYCNMSWPKFEPATQPQR